MSYRSVFSRRSTMFHSRRMPFMFDFPVVTSVSFSMPAYFSELSMIKRSAAMGQNM